MRYGEVIFLIVAWIACVVLAIWGAGVVSPCR